MTRTQILLALDAHRISHADAEHLLAASREPRPHVDDLTPSTLEEAARAIGADRGDRQGWLR